MHLENEAQIFTVQNSPDYDIEVLKKHTDQELMKVATDLMSLQKKLGHPSKQAFVKMLRDRGASTMVRTIAANLHCMDCQEASIPPSRRAVTLEGATTGQRGDHRGRGNFSLPGHHRRGFILRGSELPLQAPGGEESQPYYGRSSASSVPRMNPVRRLPQVHQAGKRRCTSWTKSRRVDMELKSKRFLLKLILRSVRWKD